MNIRTLFVALAGATAMIATITAQTPSASDLYQEALRYQESKGDVVKAIEIYKALISQYPKDAMAPKALLELASCYEKTGQPDASATYERIVREYGSSPSATAARARLAAPVPQGGFAEARQVWNDTGSRVSPDGKYLTLTDWDDTGDLMIRELPSGRMRRLTAIPKGSDDYTEDSLPSPDGKSILYIWWNDKSSKFEVRLIGRDGGQPRVVFSSDDKIAFPSPLGWTADGKNVLILFTHDASDGTPKKTETDIMMVPLSNGSPRVIKRFDGSAIGGVRVSPTLDYVAFDQPISGKPERDVFILSLSDGAVWPLASHVANDRMLDWFPDGNRLLFLSDRAGTFGIWSVPVSNGRAQGQATLVRADTGDIQSAGFTKHGDYYFNRVTFETGVSMGTIDWSAGKASPLQRLEGRFQSGQSQAAWSTDGTQIAYVQATKFGAAFTAGRGGGVEADKRLAIQTIATGEIRLLNLPMINMVNPAWVPGDKAIILQGNAQGGQGLYRVDVAPGTITAFAVRPPDRVGSELNREEPSVSSDGRTVFFRRFGNAEIAPPSSLSLMARDFDSPTERTIVAGGVRSYSVSPDARWVAIRPRSAAEGSVLLYPMSGGEPRVIARDSPAPQIAPIAWTKDSHSLLYFKPGDKSFELWQVPIDGSAPRNLGLKVPRGAIGRISIHPDGSRIAISNEAPSRSTWVMQKK